jgi:predicted SprT family Zn-dependent metalloprotease
MTQEFRAYPRFTQGPVCVGREDRYLLGSVNLLEALFHDLNRQFFGSLLPLPKLLWNSRLSSTAGRFCPGSRNPLRPRPPEIEVASYLRDLPEAEMHVRDTVLHEMIHYYLWHVKRPHGHTAEFHQIMRRVGAKRYNPVPKERAPKHWYECPCCRKRMPAKRKLGISACAACCKRHNGGQYSERFRLRRLDPGEIQEPAPGKPPPAPPPSTSPARPPEKPEEKRLPPMEIIRRLEELKRMLANKKPGA